MWFEGIRHEGQNIIFDVFSTREIAIACWGVLGIMLCFSIKYVRQEIAWVLKAAFVPKLFSIYIAILAYCSLIIYGLHRLNFWNWTLLKDSIIWSLFSAIPLCFGIIGNKRAKDYLFSTLTGILTITVILQFITSSYTFGLVFELISLPILVVIGTMQAITGDKEEYKLVTKLLNILVIGYGLYSIGYSLLRAINDYKELLSTETLKSFIFPFIMLIAYFPFVYFFALLNLYEQVFILVKTGVKDNIPVYRYLKRKTLMYFNVRLFKLDNFRHTVMFSQDFFKSKSEVDDFFVRYSEEEANSHE